MCLLTYIPSGKNASKKQLENSACSNPHGFGYAVIINDELIIGKGMDSAKVIAELLDIKKRYPHCEALFHCRYSTHGTTTEDNCHPFYIGNDPLTVLAHNGILDIPVFDNRSDTRTFAEDLFPSYDNVGGIDNPFVYESIEKWASGSKIIIFTVNPKYAYNVYILNEKLGHWKNGVWWSNYSYEDTKASYYSTSYKGKDLYSEDIIAVCESCNAELTQYDIYDGMCEYCGYCGVCLTADCLCYEKYTAPLSDLMF